MMDFQLGKLEQNHLKQTHVFFWLLEPFLLTVWKPCLLTVEPMNKTYVGSLQQLCEKWSQSRHSPACDGIQMAKTGDQHCAKSYTQNVMKQPWVKKIRI